jgi:hypothetical protein
MRMYQVIPRCRGCGPSEIPGIDNRLVWGPYACSGAEFRSSSTMIYVSIIGQDSRDRTYKEVVPDGQRSSLVGTEIIWTEGDQPLHHLQ